MLGLVHGRSRKRGTGKASVEGGRRHYYLLTLGALGVVYGDIGTSPLYAIRQCFQGLHPLNPTRENVLGILSLIFWSLIVVISVKYLLFVMRADNRGEGGILALMSLMRPHGGVLPGRKGLMMMGLFGAALLYGDGMITPAISVLSAVEGLKIATPVFEPYVDPITVAILIGLFFLQPRGSGRVGTLFGPVMLLWFFCLSVLGVWRIVEEPDVLVAMNPIYALRFFMENEWLGFLALGSVFLVVTGGEALYADMGHFGLRPIRLAWFSLVLPSLLLNYFGQGALLLRNPAACQNPFYLMGPSWALYPMVVLSTAATIIASQAVISGAFSLTRQAVQLGYSPRLEIRHTSAREIGQIYVPSVNWALMLATIGLVLGFHNSDNLAAAYGVAVTTTMAITTVLLARVARDVWGWSRLQAGLLAVSFLGLDLAFFGANILKIAHGGWFPLVVAAGIFILMTTWRKGREILNERMRTDMLSVETFLQDLEAHPVVRVPGNAVFMSREADGIPQALLHNLKHNKVIHQKVVFVTVVTEEAPHLGNRERVKVTVLGQGFYRVVLIYGFMEDPDVPETLAGVKEGDLDFLSEKTSYFLGKETLLATPKPGMALWRERLFAFMSRNSRSATSFYRLPPNRVVELGAQIEL